MIRNFRRCLRIWARHKLLSIIFVLAVLLTVGFAWNTIDRALHWADAEHHQRSPEGWMTPRYIARSWDVPQQTVDEILELPDQAKKARKQRLRDLARDEGVPLSDLIQRLEEGLARFKDTPDAKGPRK